jgi:hypothetical protein
VSQKPEEAEIEALAKIVYESHSPQKRWEVPKVQETWGEASRRAAAHIYGELLANGWCPPHKTTEIEKRVSVLEKKIGVQ